MVIKEIAKHFCYHHLTCLQLEEGDRYVKIWVLKKDVTKIQIGLIPKLPHTKTTIHNLPWWKCWVKKFIYIDCREASQYKGPKI